MITEAKTVYACDFCGKDEEVSRVNEGPTGWANLDYIEMIPLGLVSGVPRAKHIDLCPECLSKVLNLGASLKESS